MFSINTHLNKIRNTQWVFLTWLLFVILALRVNNVASDGKCIKGKYHKASPGPELGKFGECKVYEKNSCCTPEFTVELAATRTEKLYNHTWDLCKNLSRACERFWIEQECFYQCDPYIYKYQHMSSAGAIHGVPICSSYCDSWFDACKNDQICVEDVLTGYEFNQHGINSCPVNSTCQTYASMFKNGEGLCNKMWNTSYTYSTDKSVCMEMTYKDPTASTTTNSASVIFLFGGLTFLLAML